MLEKHGQKMKEYQKKKSLGPKTKKNILNERKDSREDQIDVGLTKPRRI